MDAPDIEATNVAGSAEGPIKAKGHTAFGVPRRFERDRIAVRRFKSQKRQQIPLELDAHAPIILKAR